MHETGQTSTQDLSFTSIHGWVITYATRVPHFVVTEEVSSPDVRAHAVDVSGRSPRCRTPAFNVSDERECRASRRQGGQPRRGHYLSRVGCQRIPARGGDLCAYHGRVQYPEPDQCID